MEGAAARGQSLGKSADVGSVEGVSPRPRRRLDLPATLPHDPSALRTFLAGAPVAGLKPGRREVVYGEQRRLRGLYGLCGLCACRWAVAQQA